MKTIKRIIISVLVIFSVSALIHFKFSIFSEVYTNDIFKLSQNFFFKFYNKRLSQEYNKMYNVHKDESKQLMEKQKVLHLQRKFQNVPLQSLKMKFVKTWKKPPGCSIYPKILDINFSNTYWQIFKNQGSTFHLYGAYFGSIFLLSM